MEGHGHILSIPQSRPRIVLNRSRSLMIVTLAYGSAAWAAGLLFRFVEASRGVDDFRDVQVTTAFAVIMGFCWLVSVVLILRRR